MSRFDRSESPPELICHIVYRFDVGGLENGVVNLINYSPRDGRHHVVIALTESTKFAERIKRAGVQVFSLNKRPGKDLQVYIRLYRLLRRLRPSIVHTRNFGTLDCQIVAWVAGVPGRIHGEHGWDVGDPDGATPRYRLMRRAMSLIVHRFVAVSEELERWLASQRIPASKIVRICNGVDTKRFQPRNSRVDGPVTFGTVTRFSEIKDPLNSLEAFLIARDDARIRGDVLKLIMVGDGPLLDMAKKRVREAGAEENICIAGKQDHVEDWLRKMDVFVLGSRREGISNTILEAMAAGLPIIATRTGGNKELVQDDCTGMLVRPESSGAMAEAMLSYQRNPAVRHRHASAGRKRALEQYSIGNMIEEYADLYDSIQTR